MKPFCSTVLFLISILSLQLDLINSQAVCATPPGGERTFCLFSKEVDSSTMEFRLESYVKTGWIGIGFGVDMGSAEVYVAWANSDNTVTLSRRTSTGRRMPQTASQSEFEIQTSETRVNEQGFIVATFRRAKSLPSSTGVEVNFVNGQSNGIIWAFGETAPSGPSADARFDYHRNNRGVSQEVRLFDTSSAFQEGAPVRDGADSTTGGSSDHTTLILAHGFLMALAWLVFAPAGVFIARFFKQILGAWWFRLHIGLMMVGACVITIISAILAGVAIGELDLSRYTSLGVSHIVIGLLLTVFCCIQVISGFVIDKLFDPARTAIPWYDKLHWWVGRGLSVFGIMNVAIGIALWGSLGNNITAAAVLYAIWTLVIVGLFGLLSVKYGQTHDAKGDEGSAERVERTGYQMMGNPTNI